MKTSFLLGLALLSHASLALEVRHKDGLSFLSLQDLSRELQLDAKWSTLSCGWTYVNADGQHLRLQCGMAMAGLDSGSYKFKSAPFSDAQGFWVPAAGISALLDSLSPYALEWDEKKSALSVQTKKDLASLEAYDTQGGLRLRLKMNRDLAWMGDCQDKSCNLVGPLIHLDPKQLNPKLAVKSLQSLQWSLNENQSVLKFQTKTKIKSQKLSRQGRVWQWDLQFQNQAPVAIEVKPQLDWVNLSQAQAGISNNSNNTKSELQPVSKPSNASNPSTKANLSALSNAGIRDIVLDPGHGGKDAGASGAKSKEKDLTLALGLILRDKLEAKGFRVRMTRTTDTLIELSQRPKMASKWKGDLFISLHCNAAEAKLRESASGFKAYILRDDASSEDEALARRENTFLRQNGAQSRDELSPVDWIEQEHQLNLYTKESERFAKFLVNSMESQKRIPKLGTGAGQAGFMVLVGAFMPAVLLELGFISHPKDEEMLNSSSGQEILAEKISQAISNYNLDLQKRSREE